MAPGRLRWRWRSAECAALSIPSVHPCSWWLPRGSCSRVRGAAQSDVGGRNPRRTWRQGMLKPLLIPCKTIGKSQPNAALAPGLLRWRWRLADDAALSIPSVHLCSWRLPRDSCSRVCGVAQSEVVGCNPRRTAVAGPPSNLGKSLRFLGKSLVNQQGARASAKPCFGT